MQQQLLNPQEGEATKPDDARAAIGESEVLQRIVARMKDFRRALARAEEELFTRDTLFIEEDKTFQYYHEDEHEGEGNKDLTTP